MPFCATIATECTQVFADGKRIHTTDNSTLCRDTTENLGAETIEGILATGTRITTTIPSGRMGNELPMVVTSERAVLPWIEGNGHDKTQ